MLDWQSDLAMQRQRDMLNDAKQYRLLAEARACEESYPGLAGKALCRLGTLLVVAGRWLQSKSGAAPTQKGSLVFLSGRETAAPRQDRLDSLRKVA
ncbi:MAG: hypothetical protein QOH93_1670 [Chloroflexia bacterium]|jgi:hypothetical protein|nr:hypothetical protein [Chloroflexia bacterium]